MSIVTLIQEYWRFFCNHLLRIILGALIIAGLSLAGREWLQANAYQAHQAERDYLAQVYQQEPATFQAVITTKNGELFTVPYLLDEYFSSAQVVDRIEKETGISIKKTLQAEKTLGYVKSKKFRGGLAALLNEDSQFVYFRFLLGQNAEENLKIAQAYARLMNEEELSFLSPAKVTVLQKPIKGELIPQYLRNLVPNGRTLSPIERADVKFRIIHGIMGLLIGLILTTILLLVHQAIKPKIAYAFEYTWDFMDTHVIYHRRLQNETSPIMDWIDTPKNLNRIVVNQVFRSGESLDMIATENELRPSLFCRGLDQLDMNISTIQDLQEIVIMIESFQTEKTWLKNQIALARLYRVPLKLIHVI